MKHNLTWEEWVNEGAFARLKDKFFHKPENVLKKETLGYKLHIYFSVEDTTDRYDVLFMKSRSFKKMNTITELTTAFEDGDVFCNDCSIVFDNSYSHSKEDMPKSIRSFELLILNFFRNNPPDFAMEEFLGVLEENDISRDEVLVFNRGNSLNPGSYFIKVEINKKALSQLIQTLKKY